MRRIAILLAAVSLLVLAAPALAHEEITPSRFKTQTPTFFELSAANEKKVDLTKVTVDAPSGIAFGASTRPPAGWSVAERTDERITFAGGAIKPDGFDTFGFEIEGADKAASVTWRVTLSFADGSSEAPVEVAGQAVDDLASGGTSSGGGSGRSTAALVVAIAAAVLAVFALLRSSTARAAKAAGPPADESW